MVLDFRPSGHHLSAWRAATLLLQAARESGRHFGDVLTAGKELSKGDEHQIGGGVPKQAEWGGKQLLLEPAHTTYAIQPQNRRLSPLDPYRHA